MDSYSFLLAVTECTRNHLKREEVDILLGK